MIVNGIDISTWGFRFLRLNDGLGFPGRKPTTRFAGVEQNEIVLKTRFLRAEIIGRFADTAGLVSAINSLKAELEKGKIPFVFPNHQISIEGWCDRGMKVKQKRNFAHCIIEISFNELAN